MQLKLRVDLMAKRFKDLQRSFHTLLVVFPFRPNSRQELGRSQQLSIRLIQATYLSCI